MDLRALNPPIVQAPLAGGASTPQLTAAVTSAGGFGFLAAGYKTVEAVAADIRELRALSEAPFGVNIFAPPAAPGDPPHARRIRCAPRGRRRPVWHAHR